MSYFFYAISDYFYYRSDEIFRFNIFSYSGRK